jgi:hypothetical protein
MKLGWCGVTASGASVRSYRVYQSTNNGVSFSTSAISTSSASSGVRNLSIASRYGWRLRVVDSAGRTGSYGPTTTDHLGRIQDSSTSIHYSAGWKTSRLSGYSGGTERAISRSGGTATVTVTGVRGFAIVASRAVGRGSFRVYVDDKLVATISERATTTQYRRVLYTRSVSATSSHTIVIKSTSSSRIDLDAIVTLS